MAKGPFSERRKNKVFLPGKQIWYTLGLVAKDDQEVEMFVVKSKQIW